MTNPINEGDNAFEEIEVSPPDTLEKAFEIWWTLHKYHFDNSEHHPKLRSLFFSAMAAALGWSINQPPELTVKQFANIRERARIAREGSQQSHSE